MNKGSEPFNHPNQKLNNLVDYIPNQASADVTLDLLGIGGNKMLKCYWRRTQR